MRLLAVWVDAHIFALCCADRHGVDRYIREAAHIDPVMIRRGAFIVKHIYPAD